MASTSVFFSYSRRDAGVAQQVAAQIDDLGLAPWLDQRLSGGQPWWDTILENIRRCERFVFILSDASLRSKACRAELDYAHHLGRSILPVETAPVIDQLLPSYLAETQRIPAADLAQLARALLSLPPARPLPDPLPPPPPVPLSYLEELADTVDRDELSLAEQRNLLGAVKALLRDEDERDAGVALLQRLRHHPTVNAWVAEEVDAELAKLGPARPAGGSQHGTGHDVHADRSPLPPPPPPPPPPTPGPARQGPQRRSRRPGWIVAA